MLDTQSELYRPVNSVKIPGEQVDIRPARENTFPFATFISALDPNPIFSVVTVLDEKGHESSPIRLEKISPEHGRSNVVTATRGAIWGDHRPTSILFGSADIKGNKFDMPFVETDRTSGFRVNGLFDLRYVQRIDKVGKFLRSVGVETEKAEFIVLPKEFYYRVWL